MKGDVDSTAMKTRCAECGEYLGTIIYTLPDDKKICSECLFIKKSTRSAREAAVNGTSATMKIRCKMCGRLLGVHGTSTWIYYVLPNGDKICKGCFIIKGGKK